MTSSPKGASVSDRGSGNTGTTRVLSTRSVSAAPEIDQGIPFVDDSAALRESAAGVELPGPGVRIIGIEANGVDWPLFCNGARVFERHPSQPLTLMRD